MASEKINRKDLKKLDSFQQRTIAYLEKLAAHKKTLYAVGIALLLLIVGGGFGYSYFEKQRLKTESALVSIDMEFNKEFRGFADGIQAKMKPLQDQMQKLKPGKDDAAIQKIQEKLQDIQIDYASAKPDHKGSLQQYLQFFEQDKSKAGLVAGLQAVATLLDTNAYDKATEQLLKIQQRAKNDLFYKNQTADLLTSLYEQQKKHDLAIAQSEILLKSKVDYYKQRGLMALARSYTAKGDKDKAVTYYDQFLKDYKDSSFAAQVKSLKAML